MENLSLATSGVDHQTKKSLHGTSSGRTFASESISDPRHLRSLLCLRCTVCGCVYGVYIWPRPHPHSLISVCLSARIINRYTCPLCLHTHVHTVQSKKESGMG